MLELRNITSDEFERWMSTESRAHGNRPVHDPERLRPRFDLGRSIAVFEDDRSDARRPGLRACHRRGADGYRGWELVEAMVRKGPLFRCPGHP